MKTFIRFNSVCLLLPALLINASSARAVEAHVTVEITGTNFTYTLFNDETNNSPVHLDAFNLGANAPFVVVASPPGWGHVTDNFSYVSWFSTNSTPPYMQDIAPGASLGGFSIGSRLPVELPSELVSYGITAWNHAATNSAAGVLGSVEAPSVLTVEAQLAGDVTNNNFQLKVIGVPESTYVVEKSADLQTWTPVITNAVPFTWLKTNVGSSTNGFFRAFFESGYSVDEPEEE